MPTIFAEYDRLAAEYVERRRDGRWFNFFHFMVDLDHGPCVKKRVKGCGAGGEYVAVTPEGDIYPCHQFVGRPGFRMGSVLNEEFDTAMQSRFEDNCRAHQAAVFFLLGALLLRRRLLRQRASLQRRHLACLIPWNASWKRSAWNARWPSLPSSAKPRRNSASRR